MGAFLILGGASTLLPGLAELWLFLIQALCSALNYVLVNWLGADPQPIPQNPDPWVGITVIIIGSILISLSILKEKDVIIIDKKEDPDGSVKVRAIVIAESKESENSLETRMQRALTEATTQRKVLKKRPKS
ncbi:MAG: hypothetical protein AAF546_06445 [Verrucomicrobiota bacterium]